AVADTSLVSSLRSTLWLKRCLRLKRCLLMGRHHARRLRLQECGGRAPLTVNQCLEARNQPVTATPACGPSLMIAGHAPSESAEIEPYAWALSPLASVHFGTNLSCTWPNGN